jgi:ADP-ribose pyrophosphatase YjhB (NUDIX family)
MSEAGQAEPGSVAAAAADVEARRYPPRPVVGVGGVAFIDGKVLLIKRRFEPLAGRWSIPGGALELGESLHEGLAREMREETGLVVEVGPLIELFDRIMRDADGRVQFHYVLADYLCRPVGGNLAAGSDVAEVTLADADALGPYDLTERTREVIGRARRFAPATSGPTV